MATTKPITADTILESGMVVEIPPLVPSLPAMYRTVTGSLPGGIVTVDGPSFGWFRPANTTWRLVVDA